MNLKVLKGKVERRLSRIMVKVIPYNTAYKPTGYYETAKEYAQSEEGKAARWIEVYPAYVSHSDVPSDLNDTCLEYYKSAPERAVPPAILAEVLDAREYQDSLFGGTIMSRSGKVIGDISYFEPGPNGKGRAPVQQNSLFQQRYFVEPKYYKGTVFSAVIGFNGSDNYYHFMFDCLTKLHLLRKSGLYDTVDWFLMPYPKEEYHMSMLKVLGIPEEKIIFEHENVHIKADRIIATFAERPYNHTPPWMFQFLRESFLKKEVVQDTGVPLVYISRSDSHRRNVANEDELLQMLTPYGFKKFTLASLNFVEKVKLFASAKIIIAPHGAGLANLTFCQEGSSLIEFFTSTYVCACYSEMAQKVGMHYNYFVFDHVATEKFSKGVDDHITVDVKRVQTLLDQVLEKYESPA